MNPFNYSIVILSYNHPDLTQKTLSSVIALQFPPEHVVLVHNGSVEKNVTTLRNQFPTVQHLILEKNCGYAGGANAGLKFAFCENSQVLFLTNDIEMISLPKLDSFTGLITALILKRKTLQVDSVMGSVDTRTARLQHLREMAQPALMPSRELYYAPGTAFGMTRLCFETMGGFDESFHTYWEDVNFGVRAMKAGFPITHEPTFKLLHKIGKTCHKDRFYTLYLFQRNRRKFMTKHGLSNLGFWVHYAIDMAKLFFRICFRPQPAVDLKFWWRALHE